MSAFGIDAFNFEYWEGQPPAVPHRQMRQYHRAGANGVALQFIGIWGEPFEVTLTSHWGSSSLALAGFALMNEVIGTGWLTMKYANLNYTGLFGVGYHALKVEQVDLRTALLLIGPGYAYTNGGVLVTRWQLQPEKL